MAIGASTSPTKRGSAETKAARSHAKEQAFGHQLLEPWDPLGVASDTDRVGHVDAPAIFVDGFTLEA